MMSFNVIIVLIIGLVVVNGAVLEEKTTNRGELTKNVIVKSIKLFQNNILEAAKAFEKYQNKVNNDKLNEFKNKINILTLQSATCMEVHQDEINDLILSVDGFNDYCTNLTETISNVIQEMPILLEYFQKVWTIGEKAWSDFQTCQSESGFNQISCLLNVYYEILSDLSKYKKETIAYLLELRNYFWLVLDDFYHCLQWNSNSLVSKIKSVEYKIDLCMKDTK